MSKKTLIIVGAILTVAIGAGAGVLVFGQKLNANRSDNLSGSENGVSSLFQASQNSTTGTTVYQDESGYSFSYPDSVKIKDVTPVDDNYYSSLELSRGMETLKVNITVGNTNPYKADKSASLVGSTTMGGISANQYNVGGRLVSVAIDQGVLYVIDGPKDGSFWEDLQGKILSTFKFGTAQDVTTTDANTSYEEEVVE